MESEFRAAVGALLQEANTLTLATIEPDGSPRATPLMFAVDDELRPLFLSDPDTQHIRNLSRIGEAAAAVYPAVDDWRSIHGLQMKGHCVPVPDEQLPAAMEHYRRRFPFISQLEGAVAASRLYRFEPAWVRLIDNRQEFGHRQETTWE